MKEMKEQTIKADTQEERGFDELMKAKEADRWYDPDEARDRRQQHRFAVKFSNRRK